MIVHSKKVRGAFFYIYIMHNLYIIKYNIFYINFKVVIRTNHSQVGHLQIPLNTTEFIRKESSKNE